MHACQMQGSNQDIQCNLTRRLVSFFIIFNFNYIYFDNGFMDTQKGPECYPEPAQAIRAMTLFI